MKTQTKNSTHREKRDTNRKELIDIKSENRSLKKQVSRLKKMLGHADLEAVIAAEANDWGVKEKEEEDPKVSGAVCPKCGSPELGKYVTPGGKTLLACKGCKKFKSVIAE